MSAPSPLSVDPRLALELVEVGARAFGDRVGDDAAGRRPDAVEVGQRAGLDPGGELGRVQLVDDGPGVAEGPHLLGRRQGPVDEVDGAVDRAGRARVRAVVFVGWRATAPR